jgi:hypothetical protein
VALLLSRENGELIRHVEWPLGESTQKQRIGFGSCIYPLRSGSYVGIINQRLQVFDSSFNVIHDRVLDTIKRGEGSYNLIVPLSGKFIILGRQDSGGYGIISEIIDSDTLKTVERFEQLNFSIKDIWEDRLLAEYLTVQPLRNIRKSDVYEKKIGAPRWNDIEAPSSAKYTYNGAKVATVYIGQPPDEKRVWLMIENGKKDDIIFKDTASIKSSWNTPIIACERYKVSVIRRMLDLFGKHWIEAYDSNTRQVLLATKKYSLDSIPGDEIVDYAISPDGNSVVLMTKKKIEFYNVKPPKDKKRK